MPEARRFELGFDHGQCRFCGSSLGQREFWTETYAGSGQSLRRCGHCAGVYLAPDFTVDGLQRFYTEHYRRLFPAEVAWRDSARFFAWRGDAELARRRLALIAGQLPAAARLFEMGSGFGAFLGEAARLRADLRLSASEPDASHRQRLLGTARVAFVEGPGVLPDASLDALVAFHVLEHLADPRGFLVEVARLLAPGGLAWIEVPDLFADWRSRNYVQPAHLSYFDAELLARLARAAGLEVRYCGSHPAGGELAENLWLELRAARGSGAAPLEAATAARLAAIDGRLERVAWGWRERLKRLLKRTALGLLGAGLVGEWQRWRQYRRRQRAEAP